MFTPPQALCLFLPLLSLTAALPGHRAHPRRAIDTDFPKTRTIALQTWVATSTTYETKTKVLAIHDVAHTVKVPTHYMRTFHTTRAVELTPTPTPVDGPRTVYQAIQPIERIEVINVVASTVTPEPTPTPVINIEKVKIVKASPQDDVPVVVNVGPPAEKEMPCSTVYETFYSTQTNDIYTTIELYTPAVAVVTPAARVVKDVLVAEPLAAAMGGRTFYDAQGNLVTTLIAPLDGALPLPTPTGAGENAIETIVMEDLYPTVPAAPEDLE